MATSINIIPLVQAQTADAIAQPTFGVIQAGGGSTATASVLLTSSATTVNEQDSFAVQVRINTNGIGISEYRLSISYDPTFLSIIDSDTTTPGVQIEFNDPVFQISDPSKNNLASTSGTIILDAKNPSGNTDIPRNNVLVATIHFQAFKAGQDIINVVNTGQNSTQLITLSGTTLDYSQNYITTIIQQGTASSSINNSSTSSTIVNVSSNSSISSQVFSSTPANPPKIPNTGIVDNPGTLITFVIGSLLIIFGILLTRDGNKEKRIDSD